MILVKRERDIRTEFARATKLAAQEKAQKDSAIREAELLAGYDDSTESSSQSDQIDQELENEWGELRRVAMVRFPEGVQFLGLTPKNKLVAIAFALGWSVDKIAKASGLHRGTVSKWINKRNDIKLFLEEFNLATNPSTDIVADKFKELEYAAFHCIRDILKDQTRTDGMLRLKADTSKWVFERTRGKPTQSISHSSSTDFRKFLDAMNAGNLTVEPGEEEELFKS